MSVKHSEIESDDEDEVFNKPRRPLYTLLMSLLCLSSLTMIIAGATWLAFELMLSTDPQLLFSEMSNCQVLNVTHEFISDVDTCIDRYQYKFNPKPGSGLVITQQDDVNRTNTTLCSVPDAVGISDASLIAGQTSKCYVLDPASQPIAAIYIATMNCGEPSPPCYSIVDITSTHNAQPGLLASAAFCVGGFTLMAFLIL